LAVIHRGARWPGWDGTGGCWQAGGGSAPGWRGVDSRQVSGGNSMGVGWGKESQGWELAAWVQSSGLAWLGCPVGTGTSPVSRVAGSQLRVQQRQHAGQEQRRQGSPKIQKNWEGGKPTASGVAWQARRRHWPVVVSGPAREHRAGAGHQDGAGLDGHSRIGALPKCRWLAADGLCERRRLDGVTTRPLMVMICGRGKGRRGVHSQICNGDPVERTWHPSVPAGMETGGAAGREEMET